MTDRNGRSLGVRAEAKGGSGREIEFFSGALEFELKTHDGAEVEDGKKGMFFEGYASIFNTPDSYKDIIKPGAFKASIKAKGPKQDKKVNRIVSDIKSLWQHNPDWPFGLPQHIEEDSTGLLHRTLIADTNENRDRVEYMSTGIVSGQSIGFVTLDAEFDEDDDEDFWPMRYIKEVDLWEFSPVTFPAHADAITTLVQKHRALQLAVKSHANGGRDGMGGLIEFAQKSKSVNWVAVEEAVAIFKAAADSEEEVTGDTEGGDVDDAGAGEGDQVPPADEPDTDTEDSEFIKRLEAFDEEVRYAKLEQRIGGN